MHHWIHRLPFAGRRLAAGLLAGGLALAGMAAQASDDPPGRVGRLAEGRGQVWLLEEGQGEWQTASLNRPLTTADRLATDRGGRAVLEIGSTTIRLDEASDLEIARLDDDRIELMLHSGAAAVRVREYEVAREVQITTPEGRFAPRGAGLFRLDRTDRGTLAGVSVGELDFESSDSQLTLRPGQRADLWFDDRDRRTHYSWTQPVNDDFEQWVRREDGQEQRWAANRPISPEMTGAQDLDRHGQWGTHPEYGAVWYPTTVVAGWAPYRYGRWAWVRPWGWTWVDDAPWGFAPFHYGRWVHWGGRWVWAPGTYVRRPVYAPAMVAWVGGSHFSMSIRVGGGQPVGWVPLAPREVYYPAYRVSPVYIKQVNVTHIHIHDRDPRPPRQPIMYRNSQVRGGVTVVSSDVLTKREAVYKAPRPADDDVVRVMRSPRAVDRIEPPKPADASLAPRQPVARERRGELPPPPTRGGRVQAGDGPTMRNGLVPSPQGREPAARDNPGRDGDRRDADGPTMRHGVVPAPASRDKERDAREPRDDGEKGPTMRAEQPARPPVSRPPVSPAPREVSPAPIRRDGDAERGGREPRVEQREQPRMQPQPYPAPAAPRAQPREERQREDRPRDDRPQRVSQERPQPREFERSPERVQERVQDRADRQERQERQERRERRDNGRENGRDRDARGDRPNA